MGEHRRGLGGHRCGLCAGRKRAGRAFGVGPAGGDRARGKGGRGGHRDIISLEGSMWRTSLAAPKVWPLKPPPAFQRSRERLLLGLFGFFGYGLVAARYCAQAGQKTARLLSLMSFLIFKQ